MFSIQQFLRTIRNLQGGATAGNLVKSVKCEAAELAKGTIETTTKTSLSTSFDVATVVCAPGMTSQVMKRKQISKATLRHKSKQNESNCSRKIEFICQGSKAECFRHDTHASINSSDMSCSNSGIQSASLIPHLNESGCGSIPLKIETNTQSVDTHDQNSTVHTITSASTATTTILQRNQQIKNLYKQQLHDFHTNNKSLCTNQKQTQFAMSSLAAESFALKQDDVLTNSGDCQCATSKDNRDEEKMISSSASGKPCFSTGLSDILKFMELIGNLKHTKRTGWVLRDVNDCESISGHMYRMSMMTFLLDGSEGLNQIRCMELALVHDLAESLVGDITPFCGVSKEKKRAMEFKAMTDICKLIEPRGNRIMELFEEYELGKSAESKFVKDLDRLDMVMQAFEYEKRDNCLLKHQEFFDSTEGKFNHPFVKKIVDEIYEQRRLLAKVKGATPPPPVHVPDMDLPTSNEVEKEQAIQQKIETEQKNHNPPQSQKEKSS